MPRIGEGPTDWSGYARRGWRGPSSSIALGRNGGGLDVCLLPWDVEGELSRNVLGQDSVILDAFQDADIYRL